MLTFLYLEINVIGIILLLIMYFNINSVYTYQRSVDQKLFQLLLISTITILVFDSGMWFFDGKIFLFATEINYIVTIIYLILNPIICLLWLLYGDYKINNDKNSILKRLPLYSIPCILNLILVFTTIKTKWIFYIDESNIYHRGEYCLITPLLSFSYFLFVYIILIKAKKQNKVLPKEIYHYFFIFPLPPIIGSIIQIEFYGVSLIWIGFVISIFVIFINIQNNQIYSDQLTGVYNRRYLEYQLDNMSKSLFILMIDVDDFKIINDKYGHSSGDLALISIADILKQVCRKKYTISRFGGDEFVILGKCNSSLDIENLITEIKRKTFEFNSQSNFEFDISLSIGSSIYDENNNSDISCLLKQADEKMYKEKLSKRKNI